MKNVWRTVVGTAFSLAVFSAAWSATSLSDLPIITQNRVPFNILFTLDNSGSMYYTVPSDPQLSNYQKNCYKYYKYNRLYFDPNYEYLAPRLHNGTRMPNQSFTAAENDGYSASSTTRDLSTAFGIYPKDNNPDFDSSLPTGNGFTLTTLTSSINNYRGAYYFLPKDSASQSVKDGATCGANTDYYGVPVTSAAMQAKFANWYSYYRNRVMSMKAAVGEAFYLSVKEDTRVGFHTINSPHRTDIYGGFLPVQPFTGTAKQNWYKRFYEQMPSGSTPLRAAEQRAGEYFQLRKSPATNSTTTDPIQYYCQRNYHMLSTDGYWNTGSASGNPAKNNDNTIPDFDLLVKALNEEIVELNKERAREGLPLLAPVEAGDPWIPPYREKAGSNSTNTLSDVATYFWATDLRTDAAMKNDVSPTARNPATWQHMVTYGISFGARGSVPYALDVPVYPPIKKGTEEWPVPVSDSATAIDDLWHASINSRGLYANVISPAELVDKVTEMLKDAADLGTLANLGVSSPVLEPSVGTAYVINHDPIDWTGDLWAHSIDKSTGAVNPDPIWKAQEILEEKVKGTGWSTKRVIATWNTASKAGVAFRLNSLATAQKNTLGADTATQQKVLDYLRGDRSKEGTDPGELRTRAAVLGDIVNAEPVPISVPNAPYDDTFNPGYSAFVKANESRKLTVYVAANDGMLHAFDGSESKASGGGEEKWAYVPGMLYRSGADGLAALSYRLTDPLPNKFSHHFYVDQTPTIRDVDLNNEGTPAATAQWRTLLVSGLNKGGKGYFALDVTNPDAASETDAARKAMWEFTGEVANDPKMGYTFGRPLIVKTKRFGWVVFVTSGIGNQDANGRSYIWALRPKTGEVLHRFQTPPGFGSAANPLDMAHVTALIPKDKDWTATQLYAGDMQGNVWRFDVSDGSSWSTTGERIAAFGPQQPITTLPSVEYEASNLQRWVFIGTGRLLDVPDLSNTDKQTFYAIKDGTRDAFDPAVKDITRANLEAVAPTGTYTGTVKGGWYIDLPRTGERIIAPFKTNTGVAALGTFIPSTDPCVRGMGNVFVRNWADAADLTGLAAGYSPSAHGVAGLRFLLTGSGGSQLVRLVLTDYRGKPIEVKINVPGPRPSGARVIWRLIQED